jgi:hypothetical protein
LKLQYDETLSKCDFNLNIRHYSKEAKLAMLEAQRKARWAKKFGNELGALGQHASAERAGLEREARGLLRIGTGPALMSSFSSSSARLYKHSS